MSGAPGAKIMVFVKVAKKRSLESLKVEEYDRLVGKRVCVNTRALGEGQKRRGQYPNPSDTNSPQDSQHARCSGFYFLASLLGDFSQTPLDPVNPVVTLLCEKTVKPQTGATGLVCAP